MPACQARLPDGRLHFQHGPIDIVIGAELGQLSDEAAVMRRAERATEIRLLDQLSGAADDSAAAAHALVARTPSQINAAIATMAEQFIHDTNGAKKDEKTSTALVPTH